MEEQDLQTNNPQGAEMTADEAAASLSFATHLQDQLIPRQEAPVDGKTAPGEEKPVEPKEEAPKQEPVDMESFKADIMKDVENTIKKEMSSMKDMIKEALNEDEQED